MAKKHRPSIAAAIPQKQVSYLRSHRRKTKNIRELTDLFNLKYNHDYTICQIRGVLRKHKIVSHRTGQFQTGNVPWTVYAKGSGRVKRNSGSFKKGNTPRNANTLYTERVNRLGYIEIKILEENPYTGAKTRYKGKHLYLWEKHRGKINKGCCIVFSDGNQRNCVLSNLAEISKEENLARNAMKTKNIYSWYSETRMLLSKLQTTTKQVKKKVQS